MGGFLGCLIRPKNNNDINNEKEARNSTHTLQPNVYFHRKTYLFPNPTRKRETTIKTILDQWSLQAIHCDDYF